jgi:prepilin-type processing-associated H-X9-DG protein
MLQPYTKNYGIASCSSYRGQPSGRQANYEPTVNPTLRLKIGYGINEVTLADQCGPKTLASLVSSPADIALIADADLLWGSFQASVDTNGNGRIDAGEKYWCRSSSTNCGWSYGLPRHFEGINFVYADGHAKFGRSAQHPNPPGCYATGYYPNARLD